MSEIRRQSIYLSLTEFDLASWNSFSCNGCLTSVVKTEIVLRPPVHYLKKEQFYLLIFSFKITNEALGQNLSQKIKTVVYLRIRSLVCHYEVNQRKIDKNGPNY